MIHSFALFFNSGGPYMWVILAVLAVALAVVLERYFFYGVMCRRNGIKLVASIIGLLDKKDFKGAQDLAAKAHGPLDIMLQDALGRHANGVAIEEIEEGISESAITQMPRLIARLNYLSLFANIATLLGLLGTISGLQSSFSSLATVEASKKAAMLAAGIAEAMNCTAFGLIVAVPCMVLYTMLYNQQASITRTIDESIVRLVNFMKRAKG